jgi:hypothetical protein
VDHEQFRDRLRRTMEKNEGALRRLAESERLEREAGEAMVTASRELDAVIDFNHAESEREERQAVSPWFDVTRIAPCVRCGRVLTLAMEGETMPWAGTVFTAPGNYGSTVFDPIMGGEELMVTICDDCLRHVAKTQPGVIRLVTPDRSHRKPPPVVTAWEAPIEEEEN